MFKVITSNIDKLNFIKYGSILIVNKTRRFLRHRANSRMCRYHVLVSNPKLSVPNNLRYLVIEDKFQTHFDFPGKFKSLTLKSYKYISI